MFRPVLFSELKKYNAKTFQRDLFAGLTVGVVALPLAMAFAIACGLPPARGLITAVVAGFCISFFGGSKVQVGGPTGAFIVIIAGIYTKFGDGGLLQCMLMAGIMLVLFGVFKMGALIRFIPFPVVTGFTSGIAVVIFSTQIKDLFGLNVAEMPADFIPKCGALFNALPSINWPVTAVSIGTVAAIFTMKKFCPKLPNMLIAMIGATAVCQIFKLDIATIGSSFPPLPRTLPLPSLPGLDFSHISELLMPALTIALLAGMESLLSATVADGMTGDRHRPNTELTAQGIANFVTAFFGGIPATGAIARTATNIKAGAQTPVAGIVHCFTLMLIMMLCAPYAAMIPLAALAGIMAVVCYNMSEISTILRIVKGPRSDTFVMAITFFVTVLVDLVVAVELGVVLAALLFIRRMSEISNVSAITHELTGDEKFIDDPMSISHRDVPAKVEVFEVQGPFFFGAVEEFKDAVFNVFESEHKVFILRMRQVPVIDVTGLNVLDGFAERCRKHGKILVLSGVHPGVHKRLETYGLAAKIGEANITADIDKALARAKELLAI